MKATMMETRAEIRVNRDQPLSALILEDSPLDAELTLRALKKTGFNVDCDIVASAQEFSEAIKSKSYDIILSDYNLPDCTGVDAFEILKQSNRDIPLVLVTGSIGEESAVELIKQGIGDYVLKDRLARLPSAVSRALEEKRLRLEHQAAHEQLVRSEEKYHELFENANDVIYTLEIDGTLTSLNRAGERILGYKREEIIGKNFVELITPGQMNTFRDLVQQRMLDHDMVPFERDIVTKDGRMVTLEINGRVIFDAEGTPVGIQSVARDVTERRSLQAQLQQAQKMEAIGRLAGGVAHDFNNHLGVILGYSDMLTRKLNDKDPLRKYVDLIRESSNKAATLTKQLLAFSRQQTFEPRIVSLNTIVPDMAKMLRPLVGEDIEVVINLGDNLARVRVDPSQIDQIIMNLVVNARDAMTNGGRLIIETDNVELDSGYARNHNSVRPGQYVMLAVTDTGIGMDKKTQERIFEPFFTTKEKGKGTGLGLAMVYGIVRQSGGTIWVYSEPGQGTTFKVYFPSVEPEATLVEQANLETAVQLSSGIVLVAEDDEALRNLTEEFLLEGGYTVLTASNGSEAIELIGKHQGEIDLLITDAIMPGMSGRELAKVVQQSYSQIKLLFVSGYTDDAVLRNGMLGTEMNFLQKPFTQEQLLRKAQKVLASN